MGPFGGLYANLYPLADCAVEESVLDTYSAQGYEVGNDRQNSRRLTWSELNPSQSPSAIASRSAALRVLFRLTTRVDGALAAFTAAQRLFAPSTIVFRPAALSLRFC